VYARVIESESENDRVCHPRHGAVEGNDRVRAHLHGSSAEPGCGDVYAIASENGCVGYSECGSVKETDRARARQGA